MADSPSSPGTEQPSINIRQMISDPTHSFSQGEQALCGGVPCPGAHCNEQW